MNLYLDDDSVGAVLVRLLKREGHDVVIPVDVGTSGSKDPEHFTKAINLSRVLLTHNYDDFLLLHRLVLTSTGHHPGILAVRQDNDKTRDMKPPEIVRAIRNLLAANVPIADELHILNHWR
jgi:predicted nuclease of predicted toxin-antitoxin system